MSIENSLVVGIVGTFNNLFLFLKVYACRGFSILQDCTWEFQLSQCLLFFILNAIPSFSSFSCLLFLLPSIKESLKVILFFSIVPYISWSVFRLFIPIAFATIYIFYMSQNLIGSYMCRAVVLLIPNDVHISGCIDTNQVKQHVLNT